MKRVWVNGAFDVLHIGHIRLLKFASQLGKVRVGIDTDSRVKKLKGKDRPFNTLIERIEFLSSLKFVSSVTVFDSEEELIDEIKVYSPDYMVIGSDYRDKEVIGVEYVKELIYFDRIENKSTSQILNYENSSNR